jgi:hypothetical protein
MGWMSDLSTRSFTDFLAYRFTDPIDRQCKRERAPFPWDAVTLKPEAAIVHFHQVLDNGKPQACT